MRFTHRLEFVCIATTVGVVFESALSEGFLDLRLRCTLAHPKQVVVRFVVNRFLGASVGMAAHTGHTAHTAHATLGKVFERNTTKHYL